jgi:hypothetical protein
MRETGIFTGTTNSPSRSLRQSYDRYAIRAGRNLPDKEFRSILLRPLSHQFAFGKGTTLLVPLDVPSIAALAAEVRSLDSLMIGKRSGHFCHSLHVAMQFGLYLFQLALESGIQSLRISVEIFFH